MKLVGILGTLFFFISFSLGLQFSFDACQGSDVCCDETPPKHGCCAEKANCCETTTVQLDKITDDYLPVASTDFSLPNSWYPALTIFNYKLTGATTESISHSFFPSKAPPKTKTTSVILFRSLLI
jgi:hypothetical protein